MSNPWPTLKKIGIPRIDVLPIHIPAQPYHQARYRTDCPSKEIFPLGGKYNEFRENAEKTRKKESEIFWKVIHHDQFEQATLELLNDKQKALHLSEKSNLELVNDKNLALNRGKGDTLTRKLEDIVRELEDI